METATPSRWRGVVIPADHGGWGLTLEPVVLGLVVAPNATGLALGIAALAAFLVRTPLKVSLVDRRRNRDLPRTRLAIRMTFLYGALFLGGVAAAVLLADHRFWPPLAFALPLMLTQVGYDIRSRSRRLVPEIAGPVGIASVATAIALAGGKSAGAAYGLWLVCGLRAVASIVLVRAQLRRAREQPYRQPPVHIVNGVAFLIAVWAAPAGLIPRLGAAAVALLTPFAFWQFRRPAVRATVVGISQTILGVVVVILTAAGVRAGW